MNHPSSSSKGCSVESDSARTVPLGLTFDDVLLQPGESDIVPSRVNTDTRLTRNIGGDYC